MTKTLRRIVSAIASYGHCDGDGGGHVGHCY